MSYCAIGTLVSNMSAPRVTLSQFQKHCGDPNFLMGLVRSSHIAQAFQTVMCVGLWQFSSVKTHGLLGVHFIQWKDYVELWCQCFLAGPLGLVASLSNSDYYTITSIRNSARIWVIFVYFQARLMNLGPRADTEKFIEWFNCLKLFIFGNEKFTV